jgi:hypothetical protein
MRARLFVLAVGMVLAAPGVFALEAFKVQLYDRKVRVEAPPTVGKRYAVIVQNLSLGEITGKFVSGGRDLVFVTVKAGANRTVEFDGGKQPVSFQALAPAAQQVTLTPGRTPYEIPPQR